MLVGLGYSGWQLPNTAATAKNNVLRFLIQNQHFFEKIVLLSSKKEN